MIYFILSLIPWLLYLGLRTKKAFHMLQQNLYDNDKRYIKWIEKNYQKVFLGKELLMLVLILLLILYQNELIMMIVFTIFYLIMFGITYDQMQKESYKKPLVVTARIKRLIITLIILYLISIISIFKQYDYVIYNNVYIILSIFIYLQFIMVLLVVKINIPIEKIVYYYYKNKAKNKLKRMSNLKVIGITGSYGKTSSKNILSDILNIKYNALPTPKNLNTPYGLMISINNHMDKFDDIFIAEMGAYKQGEIKELCDFVHPKYGILTKIGTAHLELFKSQENIQKTKFELIESLPSDGIGILNGDDELQLNYNLKNNCKIIWIGINNKDVDVKAENIKMYSTGMTFDIKYKNEKNKYHFETKLLGYANIYNILAALALGYEFGITIEQLQVAVKMVKPVKHRLELKKYQDIYIIDDAYNSNPIGSKMALDVLNLMPGKKIIITPGMIELGDKQYEFNKQFGEYIANVCDEVILVGEKQTKPIYDGLIVKKYNIKKIHIIDDIKKAFELINNLKDKETYVLLENDLPDIFNE